jgi:uncharacterized protein YqgC (DUF456 family)
MDASDSVLMVVALILMGIGVFLSLVPLFPGPLIVWGIGTLFAFLNEFERVTYLAVGLMTVLMVIGSTAEFWMPAFGVKTQGGSCLTSLGSVGGGIIGTFVIPIPLLGTIIGAVLGALLVEMMRVGELKDALTAGRRAFELYLLSMVVEFAASGAILVVFVISLWLTG